MIMRAVLTTMLFMFCAGCSFKTTVGELKESAAYKKNGTYPVSIGEMQRRILDGFDRCGSGMTIHTRVFADGTQVDIVGLNTGAVGANHELYVKIMAVDNHKVFVESYLDTMRIASQQFYVDILEKSMQGEVACQ